uniref:Neurobeachin alpha-solenoid region domain-containing protein n=1 Tax=Setaria italica TaxID=4555 RepID=K3Y3D9_SETIT
DSPEEGVLSVLWKKYENACDKVEKEKSLQIFILQFVETFRDWGPRPIEQLVGQELGSNETAVGCCCGHPSEVILILIQEISVIASTIVEIFSYYGGVQKITSLLKAAVAQLRNLNSLLAADDQSSDKEVGNTTLMLNILVFIITIISNFMKLEITVARVPRINETTKHTPSESHLAAVTSSSPDSTISDTVRHWQQKAIVLVMEASGVNWLVELLRVIQRLNLKEQWKDLSLHFLTLCTLQSTVSGTRAQNHLRSIGGLEILLDGLGLPASIFSVLKHSSISRNERCEILLLQIQYLQILSEAVYPLFANVNNLQFLCENGRVHKFANCICWPAFMIQKFHQQKDNTKASHALDSVSGPICFLDITEWNDYSVKLSNALCSFICPSKDIEYCSDEIAVSQIAVSIPSAYLEQSVRWIIRILMTVFLCIKACTKSELPNHINSFCRIFAKTLQYYMIRMFKRVLISTPALLPAFREEGVWDLIFSGNFFYFGSAVEDTHFDIVTDVQNGDINSSRISIDSESLYCTDVNILQVEAISFLEFAATLNENTYNTPECSALLDALEYCISDPSTVSALLKCFRVILQLATEQTLASFESLDVITRVLKAACHQAQELRNFSNFLCSNVMITEDSSQFKSIEDRAEKALICTELALSLFTEYVTISIDGRILVLQNAECIECLFDLFQEQNLRKHVLEQVLALFRLPSSSAQDHTAKLQLCSKYLENFARANEKEKVDSELLIDLLVSMREIIMMDHMYYQNLFRDGGCFLHIVSLLNGNFNEVTAEQLVLNVLETLTLLLKGNDASKGAFRLLVGAGYQTLQSLILDFYKWSPSERFLDALLNMLVDCKFELNEKTTIKNEDAVVLLLNILRKSSTSLQHYGLVILQQLLKQSITNRTSCFRAGLLSFLLDWFSIEEKDDTVIEIAEIIQILGAHSICGKDIRKIFALLRCEKIGAKQKHTSLLLTSLSHMLKEKGPEAFFEFSGHDSGIEIKSPFLRPYNRGLSFSCWLRVENFPDNGMMGLFSFSTEDGKGCSAVLNRSALVYEVIAIFFPILNQIKFLK